MDETDYDVILLMICDYSMMSGGVVIGIGENSRRMDVWEMMLGKLKI